MQKLGMKICLVVLGYFQKIYQNFIRGDIEYFKKYIIL